MLTVPLVSHACGVAEFGCWLKTTLIWGINFIAYLVGIIGSLFLTLAAGLVDLVLDLNISILGSGNLVTTGFNISLNVVNLLFVLALIIIAFGTILRLEKYGMKQLLAKLIIAAILINFSLAIAGLLLDFSHVFTKFFISGGATDAAASLSDSLAYSLQPQKFSAPPSFEEAEQAATAGLLVKTIANSIFRAIFTWLLAIVLLGVAFMFFLRYFYVLILLILMPFAWFFWVVPEYSGLAKKWWDKFLEQVFFLPAAAFFIYLAIQLKTSVDVITGGSHITGHITGGNQAAAAFANGLGNASIFQTILNQIIISGILVGGLIAAQKMGIYGSSTAIGVANKIKGVALGAAGKVGKAAARGAALPLTIPGGALADATMRKGGLMDRFATKLTGVPILGRMAPGMKNMVAARQAGIEARQKEEYGSYSDDAMMAESRLFTTDKQKQAMRANELARRGLLSKFAEDPATTKTAQTMLASAKDLGLTKDILENAPQFAGDVTDLEALRKKEGLPATTGKIELQEKAVELAMAKLKPSKVESLTLDAIEKVGQYFSQAHRDRLAKEGSNAQLAAFVKAIQVLAVKEPNHPSVKFVLENPAMQRIAEIENIRGILARKEAGEKEAETAEKRMAGMTEEEKSKIPL